MPGSAFFCSFRTRIKTDPYNMEVIVTKKRENLHANLRRLLFSGVFLPLTSAKACEKSSRWLWKEKLC